MNLYNYDNDKPVLIEPGIKHFLNESLKKCHEVKETYHTFIFNIGMFLFFLIVLGCILIYKYKGKPTVVEKREKDLEKQKYILSKIKAFELAKKKARDELITGLPNWESDISALQTKFSY